MKTVVFRKDIQDKLEQIGAADILIGIPSYNNARTIGHVVRRFRPAWPNIFRVIAPCS